MKDDQQTDVNIRPWSASDYPLLERLMGDPATTVYLGGPEPLDQIRKRHERYCQLDNSGKGRMFVIAAGQKRVSAGLVGFWETKIEGQLVWETGWSVLPEYQGQGIATKASATVVELARAAGKYRFLHAFPSLQNGASNAICRKVGFTLQGEIELEARREPGTFLRFNNWRLDLFSGAPPRP